MLCGLSTVPSTAEWVQELRKLKALLQERELLLSNLSKTEHELVEVRLLIYSGFKAPLRVHRIGMQQGCNARRHTLSHRSAPRRTCAPYFVRRLSAAGKPY